MKRTILRMVAVVMMAITMSANVALGVTAAEKKPKLNKNYVSMPVGYTFALKIRNKPKKSKITWKSSNKKIATVSKKGKIKGKKPGRTRVVCIVRKGKKKVRLVCSVHISKAGQMHSTPTATSTATAVVNATSTAPTASALASATTTAITSATATPVIVTPTPVVSTPTPEVKVNTGKTIVTLGMALSELEKSTGKAAYTLSSEYEGCTWRVYNSDYKNLLLALVKDNKVVGVYADSKDISCGSINSNTKAISLELEGFSTDAYKETYYKKIGNVVINAYMDNGDDKTVEGILAIDKMTATVKNGLNSTYEKISFEVTNSFRVKNGMTAFVWNDSVANVARKHSKDMRDNNYFNHTSPTGKNAGARLKDAGLNYLAYAENIAMGYPNGFEVTYGWINSPGHRSNMLFNAVTDLGVGIESDCTYYTQVFYKGA